MFSGVPTPGGPPITASNEPPSKFFISRGNGRATPLIPADELPTHVVVVGVPRVMSLAQTAGMTSVGEVPPSGLCYQVKLEKDVDQHSRVRHLFTSPSSYAPDTAPALFAINGGVGVCSPAQGSSATGNLVTCARATSNPSILAPGNLSQAILNTGQLDNQQLDRPKQRGNANGPSIGGVDPGKKDSLEGLNMDTPRRPPFGAHAPTGAITTPTRPPSRTPRTPPGNGTFQRQFHRPISGPLREGSKTYCSYWIRHGECDYTQQGCKFLHEMPEDRDSLTKIGLRDFPRWWKELNAAKTLVWRQRSPGLNDGASPVTPPGPSSLHGAGLDDTIRPCRPEEKTVSASISRRATVATPTPGGPLIRQRVPRVWGSGTEHRPSSSPSAESDSSADSSSQAPRFIPAIIVPGSGTPKVKRLMSLESSQQGGVSVQGDAALLQNTNASPESMPEAEDYNLINLTGLRLE